MTGLLDHRGDPIRKELLTREVAVPSIGSVRSPIAGYPGEGLNPIALASLLRAADQGDPLRYFELAEQIEERDPHYVGVVGVRRRSVAQIDMTVEAASDSAEDLAKADMVRTLIARDELAEETFDILDAIPKGLSFTEIIWDSSEGQWMPQRLEWRDPRWFTFDRTDLRTPLLRGGESGNGADSPLEPFKFIQLAIKAKSGLPVRSGIARLAMWGWMFKAFTLRDWAIFAQTFGQPVRLGRYHSGASKEDKAALFRAVANIAGDCAAIVPQEMNIEFIESKNVGAGADLYEKRADWLDRQISKAVLGQTTTTDAVSGGHAVSQEHRQVQEDIETADCKALAAALNRDLIRPWMDLNFGPGKSYPRIVIARPKREDLTLLADAIPKLVGVGMRIQASEVRDKFGLSDPDPNSELLGTPAPSLQDQAGSIRTLMEGGASYDQAMHSVSMLSLIGRAGEVGDDRLIALMQAAQPVPAAPAPTKRAAFPGDAIGDRLAAETSADMGELIEQIEAMLEAAADLDEFRMMLASAYPDLDVSGMAGKIAQALVAARAAGMADLEDESA